MKGGPSEVLCCPNSQRSLDSSRRFEKLDHFLHRENPRCAQILLSSIIYSDAIVTLAFV